MLAKLVHVKVGTLFKFPRTVLTGERLLSGVNAHMLCEITFSRCGIVANFTIMPLSGRRNSLGAFHFLAESDFTNFGFGNRGFHDDVLKDAETVPTLI